MFLPFIDIILALLMSILTVAVVVLTCKVKRYAKETLEASEESLIVTQKSLEATQESLAFFSEPIVWWELYGNPTPEIRGNQPLIAQENLVIHNGTVQEIHISKKSDITCDIIREKSDTSSAQLKVEFHWKQVLVDDVYPFFGPFVIKRKFLIPLAFKSDNVAPTTKDMKVVVKLYAKYVYRGDTHHAKEEVCFVLKPHIKHKRNA